MSDVTLRRYHPDDAEAVWDLHVAALKDSGEFDERFTHRDADLERVVAEYLGTNGEFVVAEAGGTGDGGAEGRSDGDSGETSDGGARRTTGGEDERRGDGEIVAMGGFQPDEDDEDAAVIRRMRVAPYRQREGLGSLILRELEARAREAGFDRLTLDTSTDMTAAMAFYEHHGYEEFDREHVAAADRTLVFYEKTLDG